MKVTTPAPIGHAQFALEAGEAVHVLHAKSIVAYQGPPNNREDRFMDIGGAFRKKKWIRAKVQGPAMFVLGLPAGFALETVDIPADSHLLFDFRHIAYYTDGMGLRSKILRMKTAWITREFVRMKFTGPGTIGVLTAGDIATVQLDPEMPLFVNAAALIAYPEDASIRLSVYGNTLASQYMDVQWEIRGRGPVLIQTGTRDQQLEDKLAGDGWLKRLLRELLPFGSVYIK